MGIMKRTGELKEAAISKELGVQNTGTRARQLERYLPSIIPNKGLMSKVLQRKIFMTFM